MWAGIEPPSVNINEEISVTLGAIGNHAMSAAHAFGTGQDTSSPLPILAELHERERPPSRGGVRALQVDATSPTYVGPLWQTEPPWRPDLRQRSASSVSNNRPLLTS